MKAMFRDAFVAELGEVAELRPRSSLTVSDYFPPFVVETQGRMWLPIGLPPSSRFSSGKLFAAGHSV